MKKHPMPMTLVAALAIVLVAIVAIDARQHGTSTSAGSAATSPGLIVTSTAPDPVTATHPPTSVQADGSNTIPAASNAPTTNTLVVSSEEIARIRRDIIGTWQSVDDPNASLTISADGTYTDVYKGYPGSPWTGQWQLVDNLHGTPMAAYNDPGYVKLLMVWSLGSGSTIPATTQYFDVSMSLDGNSMELIYLVSGSRNAYTKLK